MQLPARRYLRPLLWLLLLADLTYSFYQYQNLPLDGDLPGLVLPQPAYESVLSDPFGWQVIQSGKEYAAPNRFFSHYAVRTYFRVLPDCLQHWLSPLDSLYLSAALARMLTHCLLLFGMARVLAIVMRLRARDFIYPLILLAPFFQIRGYNRIMGLVDQAVSYNFFYAIPFGLLLLYGLPIIRLMTIERPHKLSLFQHTVLMTGTIVLPLSGPIVPPVVLLSGVLFVCYGIWKSDVLLGENGIRGRWEYGYGAALFLIACYSLFLGTFNAEEQGAAVPLLARFGLLPIGLWGLLTKKLGVSLLIVLLLLVSQWVNHLPASQDRYRFKQALRWGLGFTLFYILLIPFGGYREYRPNILRYDLLLPITTFLLLLYGWAVLLLTRYLPKPRHWVLCVLLGSVALIYTSADGFDAREKNCEYEALELIATSEEAEVVLEQECRVLSWTRIREPEGSRDQAAFLQLMGVTPQAVRYYQPD